MIASMTVLLQVRRSLQSVMVISSGGIPSNCVMIEMTAMGVAPVEDDINCFFNFANLILKPLELVPAMECFAKHGSWFQVWGNICVQHEGQCQNEHQVRGSILTEVSIIADIFIDHHTKLYKVGFLGGVHRAIAPDIDVRGVDAIKGTECVDRWTWGVGGRRHRNNELWGAILVR